jgi:hypothetical protein
VRPLSANKSAVLVISLADNDLSSAWPRRQPNARSDDGKGLRAIAPAFDRRGLHFPAPALLPFGDPVGSPPGWTDRPRRPDQRCRADKRALKSVGC